MVWPLHRNITLPMTVFLKEAHIQLTSWGGDEAEEIEVLAFWRLTALLNTLGEEIAERVPM